MQDINQLVQMLAALKNNGKTPDQVFNMLVQQNPNYNLAMTRYQNMAKGRNPKEFILQMAKQQGLTPENAKILEQLLN